MINKILESPFLNQPRVLILALMVLKFIVDSLFTRLRQPFTDVFERNKMEVK